MNRLEFNTKEELQAELNKGRFEFSSKEFLKEEYLLEFCSNYEITQTIVEKEISRFIVITFKHKELKKLEDTLINKMDKQNKKLEILTDKILN